MPKSRPVTTAAPSVKSSTVMSIRTGFTRGIGSVLDDWSSRTPHHASARPAAAPASASSRLSVRSCRTTRQRPAPSAARIASSRRLPPARISSRLATFAHATSRTSVTAPSRISSGSREEPVSCSRIGTTAAPTFSLLSGYCFSRRLAITCRSACACAAEMPGLSRARAR